MLRKNVESLRDAAMSILKLVDGELGPATLGLVETYIERLVRFRSQHCNPDDPNGWPREGEFRECFRKTRQHGLSELLGDLLRQKLPAAHVGSILEDIERRARGWTGRIEDFNDFEYWISKMRQFQEELDKHEWVMQGFRIAFNDVGFAKACDDLRREVKEAFGDRKMFSREADSSNAGDASNRDSPDKCGYVAFPSDPSAYVSVSKVLREHTPVDLDIKSKQVPGILENYQANRIRWTRPPGKDGNPCQNRRNVHVADWIAFVDRIKGNATNDDWPHVTGDEIAERKAAVRGSKRIGR